MKKFIPFFLAVLFLLPVVSWGQIFSQDFSAGGTTNDYISATPNSGQFDNITATTNSSVSITNNALVLLRTTGGTSRFNRITNLTSGTINGMIFVFTVTVSGNTSGTTSASRVFVGSNVGNNASNPANTDYYARLAINFGASDGQFSIRDMVSSTNSSTYTGTQTITWAINHTGLPMSYTAPDATTENVANEKIDVWVGSTKVFDDINPDNAATFSGNLVQFKGLLDAGSGAVIFDNFNIVGGNGALPVELTSFRLSVVGKKVQLNWQTATEVNNYGFEVERRQTGNVKSETWETLGFVKGNGNSNSPKNYSFTDEPMGGKEFKYRLKQIDFDGAFEYSDEVTAAFQDVTTFELEQNYPNPFNPVTKISYTIPQRSNVKLRVYNMLAQMESELVNESQEAGHYQVIFNGSNLPSGTYFYKLEAGKFVEVKKFLLVK